LKASVRDEKVILDRMGERKGIDVGGELVAVGVWEETEEIMSESYPPGES